MKWYKTPNEFARKVRQEKPQDGPKEAWFLVEDDCGRLWIRKTPPTRQDLKRVLFCVDREHFLERVYGVWVERPSAEDRELLKQRRLRQTLDSLRAKPPIGRLSVCDVEKDVQEKLNYHLNEARDKCSNEMFNAKVLEETLADMKRWGRFRKLETEGDPLEKARQ